MAALYRDAATPEVRGNNSWLGSLWAGGGNQRPPDGLDPSVTADVIENEVAVELPIRPAPAALFGGARDARQVARPGFYRGLVVGAEFAEEERPVVLFGPGGGLVEIALEHAEFLFRAQPLDSQLIFSARPLGALMREVHGRVIVDRHNEMAIRGRQLQFGQVVDGVPETRPHDDGAGGVLLANDGQRFGQVLVPEFRGQFMRRLVEHFE